MSKEIEYNPSEKYNIYIQDNNSEYLLYENIEREKTEKIILEELDKFFALKLPGEKAYNSGSMQACASDIRHRTSLHGFKQEVDEYSIYVKSILKEVIPQ